MNRSKHKTIFRRTLTRRALFILVSALFACICTPVLSESGIESGKTFMVGDSLVKRIMPKPASKSIYVATDYTEIHFRLNKADIDISYMDNGLSFLRLERVIDSLGVENISAVEVISQSSPEGSLARNTWLTQNRAKITIEYIKRVFPELRNRITVNEIVESWDNLAVYVSQDPNLEEATKQKILDIIDSDINIEVKKARMKDSLGKDPNVGDVYLYLIKYYYPVIRNSGIYILHMIGPKSELSEEEPERFHVEETTPEYADSLDVTPDIIQPFSQYKRPLLALKTNLAYNAFFTKDLGWAPIYNFELELYPTENGRWTWLYEHEFPWHSIDSKHQYLQLINIQLEARRYFKKASHHTGHYLSAYIGANLYDFCFDKETGHGYQGEGGGLGLGYGYVLPLGKKPDTRWKLELFVKGGAYISYYDPYDAGNPFNGKYYYDWYDRPELFIKRNMVFRWLGPTGAGITLSYDILRKTVKNR